MEPPFQIVYLPPVLDELSRLNRRLLIRIQRAIKERLGFHADLAGKRLRSPLHHYRKLRVGDYRIIYHVEKKKITISAIGNRRDVYEDFMARLGIR